LARELEPIVKKLVEDGNTVYSFSKLNTFKQCQYGFYNTYVLKNRGIDNIYSVCGSNIHNDLEMIYNGKEVNLTKSLKTTLSELDMLGVTFMNDKIRNSWVADMKHFSKNFKAKEGEYVTEEGFIFEIMPRVYIQGYIDMVEKHKDNHIDIIDFKTSSKFDKKKLVGAGRQLVLYGIAKQDKYIVDKIAWHMLKYLNICWEMKNGTIHKKMVNRGKWVKEIGTDKQAKVKGTTTYKTTKSMLKRELEGLGIKEFEIDLLLTDSVKKNNLLNLPKEIQDKYWLEDCILEYEFTEETKKEFMDFVKDTHEKILSKDSTNEADWKPMNIDGDSFFCSYLCGHRKSCKYLHEYYEKLKLGTTKKDDEWEDLFS